MIFEFLTPLKESIVSHLLLQPKYCLGYTMKLHTIKEGLPDLSNVQVAILGVKEDRKAINNLGSGEELFYIRKNLYQLFPGKWEVSIADLGNIEKGNTPKDTYFAVSKVITFLLKKKIIPIIIGGGQEITYSNYRAYDTFEQAVNIVSVDAKFDLGKLEGQLNSQSYLSKIIMQKPNNLFNFSNIGYQTYFNPQDEITLLENMYFDTYRLGEVKNLEIVEPVFRDADIVSIDIGSVRQNEAPANNNTSPNGFYGEEICAISRYSGISDKVSSFGIYEYNSKYDYKEKTAKLIAQIIWYFIEGVSFRAKDYPYCTKKNYQKFTVLFEDDDPINFYKSDKTGRWWMEINIISDNKYKRHTLMPCTFKDYQDATAQIIPERWYRGMNKMV